MNIDTLAKELNMSAVDLLPIVVKYDNQYDLGIGSVTSFTRIQHRVLRSLLDPDYMVGVLLDKENAYDYRGAPGYAAMKEWISKRNLNGRGTRDIKQSAAANATHCGPQALAAAMRESGYTSRVIYLDTGKQGRRWFKDPVIKAEDTPSFF